MLKRNIPNMLTFINLSCGIMSIVSVLDKNFLYAAIFIIVGAVVDRYDGKIARLLNVSSDIGKELDSLADLISFGVAPALLMFYKYELNEVLFGIIILLFYVLCGAYRLARYNVSSFDGIFSGIPITIAGCSLSLVSLIMPNKITIILPSVLMILFAYMMVSRVKLKKI